MHVSRDVFLALSALTVSACGRVSFDALDSVTGDAADAAPSGDALTSGLVFHVPFEGSSTDVAGGRVPFCDGGCPALVIGRANNDRAGQFFYDKCLEYANDAALQPAVFTFALWARAGATQMSSLFGKAYQSSSTSDNSYELWIQDTDLIHFHTVNTPPHVSAPGRVIGQWQHFAASFDGTTRRLYLDGVEVDSDVAVPTLYDLDPVRIGCDRDGGVLAFRFGGEIDDVRLYDRVLDQDEIAQLAQ